MRCSALLLAGGKSTRMGRDKAFLEIDGEPLWRRQLATLRALLPVELMIAASPRAEWNGCDVIADEIPNAGPLGGLAAALRKCASPHLVVLAIDLPRLTTRFLKTLLADCDDRRGVVPRNADHFEPLAAIYPRSCAELARAALHRPDFSMQNFVRAAIEQNLLVSRQLAGDEAALFKNLNTLADL
ncbi:MAG TPA: molybdenum cofactor guanylyltransferase [Chthoniobacterales bacterium]|jgi:molybdopterin-guanine dinucleotide biosynthesis protein A